MVTSYRSATNLSEDKKLTETESSVDPDRNGEKLINEYVSLTRSVYNISYLKGKSISEHEVRMMNQLN